jgi:hypothetical protein
MNLLAIAGRPAVGLEPPPMKLLASMCIDFAIAAKLPVISYFCSLPQKDELQDGNTREVQALISMTYALIRQLVEQLPAQFTSEIDFSKKRFADLRGSSKTWGMAVSLLRDLVGFGPRPLFCIVDSLQLIDDWSTETLLEEFLSIFRPPRSSDRGRQDGGKEDDGQEGLKVLFTTTGRSRSLVKKMDPKELVIADRDGAADSPARRAGNRRFLI